MLLATVALQNKDEKRARELVEKVVARAPDWDPPSRDYSPTMRALYGQQRTALLKERTSVLDIRGVLGGQVYVDGLPRGAAPLQVVVAPGEHDVQVASDGKLSAPVKVATGSVRHVDPRCAAPAEPSCLQRVVDAETLTLVDRIERPAPAAPVIGAAAEIAQA